MDDSNRASVAVAEEQARNSQDSTGFYETVFDEAKGFGKLFWQQLVGVKPQDKMPQASDINTQKQVDDVASQMEYEQVRHKIIKMYEDQRQKKLQEEQFKAYQEEKQKQEKATDLENLYKKRQANHQVAAATSKGSAETGRNWGSE